jgi:hypothetical protein
MFKPPQILREVGVELLGRASMVRLGRMHGSNANSSPSTLF